MAKKSSGVSKESKRHSLSGLQEARKLFREAGLAFPTIPKDLAVQLKEQSRWLFSTRKIDMSPYDLQHYVHEVDGTDVDDYAVLSHSGHGVNSYAIQYYLVWGALRMFLHLGWGGVYMDSNEAALKIRHCFGLADKVVRGVQNAGCIPSGGKIKIVASDFYGSYWLAPGQGVTGKMSGSARRAMEHPTVTEKAPTVALAEALHWLADWHPKGLPKGLQRKG